MYPLFVKIQRNHSEEDLKDNTVILEMGIESSMNVFKKLMTGSKSALKLKSLASSYRCESTDWLYK